MSELSEAQKRKLLRERRQKKFSNGGASSRLNKIIGQVPDSQLDQTSPLDSPPVSKEATPSLGVSPPSASSDSAVGNEASTQEMDELIASISKPSSSRMPQRTEKPQVVTDEQPPTQETNDPQLDIFKRLMGNQQQDGSTPDLMSVFQSMNGGGATDAECPLPFVPEPVDQRVLDYHNYLVNRLKAWCVLVKWMVLSPYVYLISRSSVSQFSYLPQWILDPSNFFPVFVAFEIVAASLYYQKLQNLEKSNNVNTLQNNSKIAKLVSLIPAQGLPIPNLRDKILLALQYWDVLSMLITDVCFVLILMGICSYI